MLPLLPPDTQILCPTTVEPLLTIPGQSAPRSPATVFNSFPPACSALADAGGDAAWILFIGSNDASHVGQLAAARSPSLENALAQAIATNRSLIVAAQSPLPADLQQQHKAPLLPFLHPLQAADLVLLPRAAVTADCSLNLADVVLQQRPLLEILHRGPDCSRTPGPAAASPILNLSALRRAVKRMLPELDRPAEDFACIEAGLLLLHDFDAQAHEIVQGLEGDGQLQTADYWHGIMHRREPDPGNAAWWFRRVSGHPAASVLGRNLLQWLQDIGASAEVLQQARQLLRADHRIDSQRMIDLAGKALRAPRSTIASTLRLVQYLEIVNLLAFPA